MKFYRSPAARFSNALLLLLLAGVAHATDRNAATCSFADVNTAYGLAVDGDRVLIPAGTCDWAGNVLTVAKGVKILGVSNASPVITAARFTVTVPAGKAWTIGQFRTNGTAGFNITGCSKAGRITAVYFDTVTGFTADRLIWVAPASYGCYSTGVIDNVYFYQPQSIQVHVRESDNGGGNQSYIRPLDLGGPDAWYVEDSTFEHTTTSFNTSHPATDCDAGGRIVVRYSTLIRNYTEMHDAIVGGIRSCRKWETYENDFYPDYAIGPQSGQVGIRGGTGVVFNNRFHGYTQTATEIDSSTVGGEINIQLYRRSTLGSCGAPWCDFCSTSTGKACLNGSSAPATCTTDADCGGQPGSCIDKDGISSSPNGYFCRDQLGASGNSRQFSRPSLFWNNKMTATFWLPVYDGFTSKLNDYVAATVVDGSDSFIAENRDFCQHPTTKPASCNGITTRYTPYTYPHPLRTRAAPRKSTGGSVS